MYVRPYLTTRSLVPENQETPIQFIDSEKSTGQLFYRRNHFAYPTVSQSNYWLPVRGSVQTPLLFSMQEILRLPSKEVKVTLECAGNKRSFFEPKVFGEQWEKGAISQGYWKGVPLRTLLQLCGVSEEAKEVVVEAYDYGERTDLDGMYSYMRSLPLDKALHPDTILAYEYNGQPLPVKHGYPLRLIVPQWYAMASVKWVKQIHVIDTEFIGPFQTIDYVYYPREDEEKEAYPVTTMNVNSTIQQPVDREIMNTGEHLITGIAWTGEGTITNVEISTNNGKTWSQAKLHQNDIEYGWTPWSYEWSVHKEGEYTIHTKATDSQQRTQPLHPFWNKKGYGFNAIDTINVKIE